ncbi:hypothetical protein VNO77_34033 [Canavalia gladiata]|uniref:Uncharacterized protein n=1 Tax=Canavalia gladiata TaxID=3824 RepID=A0AAN9Q1E3_CANGL
MVSTVPKLRELIAFQALFEFLKSDICVPSLYTLVSLSGGALNQASYGILIKSVSSSTKIGNGAYHRHDNKALADMKDWGGIFIMMTLK